MKKPRHLKSIAHIFGDPMLESTGLEGGQLESALTLMKEYIEKSLLPNFSGEKNLLNIIKQKIARCNYYLNLINQDRKAQTQKAIQEIKKDINELDMADWLLLPGGWHGLNKPGHAMLYLLLPQRHFVIINTGAGSGYHAKYPQPHDIQLHFLTVQLSNKHCLMDNLVIPALMNLLIKPADYYSGDIVYNIILPLLDGILLPNVHPQHAYYPQMAGTCFWQCVDKLIFYFYRDKTHIYQNFQQTWKQSLLEDIYNELKNYIDGKDTITLDELQNNGWQTYLQLILFSIRHFSLDSMQLSQSAPSYINNQRLCFLLENLANFSEQQLKRQLTNISRYHPATNTPYCIDSSFTLFDAVANTQPPLFIPLPAQSYQQDTFIEFLNSICTYLSQIVWESGEHLINAHFVIEELLHYLPQPTSPSWKIFLQRCFKIKEIELIVEKIKQIIDYYYRLHYCLYDKPEPIEYTKQIIAIFSAYCFIDSLIKNDSFFTFLIDYSPALTHLMNNIHLIELAPALVAPSPQLADQLHYISRYVKKLQEKKIIFNFNFEGNFNFYDISSLIINEKINSTDKDFLELALKIFDRKELFNKNDIQYSLDYRIALGLIDEKRQYMPMIIHLWRDIALYCRLFVTSLVLQKERLPDKLWSYIPFKKQDNSQLSLKLHGYTNAIPKPWANYAAQLVDDKAIQWLCDTPADHIQENQVLIQPMPFTTKINRRLFNQLAEARISSNLQIITTLRILSQNVHSLQIGDLHFLLEKYLFEAGSKIAEDGSLLKQECLNYMQLKDFILHFMNTAEFYFGGQMSRIQTYLGLIHCFIKIESFLLLESKQLICHTIFDKLYQLLVQQENNHAEIAAHLILLYQNYSQLPVKPDFDIQVTKHIIISWAFLLRAKQLQQVFSNKLYYQAKKVILGLQNRIVVVLNDFNLRQEYFNKFIRIILQLSDTPKIIWEMISIGCASGEQYLVNLFDGSIYHKGYPLTGLPEEILSNSDYKYLYDKNVLALELERSINNIKVYRSLGDNPQVLTLYKNDSIQSVNILEQMIQQKICHELFIQYDKQKNSPIKEIEYFLEQFLKIFDKKDTISKIWYKDDSSIQLLMCIGHELYLASLSDLQQVFKYRIHGIRCYPQLVYTSDIRSSYFSKELFSVHWDVPKKHYALIVLNKINNNEIIVHKEISFGHESKVWTQYLPHWRLDGLLPAVLLESYAFWLACDLSPNSGFMAIEEINEVSLNNIEKQTIFLIDKEHQCHYILYLLNNNDLFLFKLDDFGEKQKKWIDLLRIIDNQSLIDITKVFFQFELPNYILAWQQDDGNIVIDLPRHQLTFRYEAKTKEVHAEQFDNFKLIIQPHEYLPCFGPKLVLENQYNEYLIILPYVQFSQPNNIFQYKDPLHSHIYSSLEQIESPSYFSYLYQKVTLELEANTILGEQYLALVYAKSRQYQLAYRHIMASWTDQLLTLQEWQLFLRYFKETEQDMHPDSHACRLRYYLLFHPNYAFLRERQISNDNLSDYEIEQLTSYSKLNKVILIDYFKYLQKWVYVSARLRLSNEMEQILCTSQENFERNPTLANRYASLKKHESVKLITPGYASLSQHQLETFFAEMSVSLGDLSEYICYYILNNKAVDDFGFSKEHGTTLTLTLSECFIDIYNNYLRKALSPQQIILILRSLVLQYKLPMHSIIERNLFKMLFQLITIKPQELPAFPLMQNGNTSIGFSLSDPSMNYTDISKMAEKWFRQLLKLLQQKNIIHKKMNFLNFTENLSSTLVAINPCMAKPYTLPEESSKTSVPIKLLINFDLDKFIEKYDFNPKQPLKHIFDEFFAVSMQKVNSQAFPLSTTRGDSSNYAKLLREDDLAKELLGHFQKDYDFFQSKLQQIFVDKHTNNFFEKLQSRLMLSLSRLSGQAQILWIKILELANKVPCSKDNMTTPIDNQLLLGIQYKYSLLAQQTYPLTFEDLLVLLLNQDRSAYTYRNSFLTPLDINTLANATIEYLIIICTIKQIKRLLSLAKEGLAFSQDEKKRQSNIEQIGKECYQERTYTIHERLSYLILEYREGYLLWEQQIEVLERLKSPFKQQIEQLIMGGGKSSTLAPLLGQSLADGKRLMVFTIPPSLVAIFSQLLRTRFRGPFLKHIHRFDIQRTTVLTPAIMRLYVNKIQNITKDKDVLIITPDVPNCLLLKWVEIAQQVYKGKREYRDLLGNIEDLLCFLQHNATQLIDEMDLVLAPLKSELNFTIGEAHSLQPTPLRWSYVQDLLLMVLTHAAIKPLFEKAIEQHQCKAHGSHKVFSYGMLELVDVDFYHRQVKQKLGEIILHEHFGQETFVVKNNKALHSYLMGDPAIRHEQNILLSYEICESITNNDTFEATVDAQNLRQLLLQNSTVVNINSKRFHCITNHRLYNNTIHPIVAKLCTSYVQLFYARNEALAHKLILAKEWLTVLLPHVLQKRLFINFGPYFNLIKDANQCVTKTYYLNKKLSVPYTGKDSPSKHSEFQHPDIVIGFTCIQYFYVGLRQDEFIELLQCLQGDLENETTTELQERRASKLFKEWQQKAKLVNITELHQLNINEMQNVSQLHLQLYQHIDLIRYYLERLVFPHYMKVFDKKLTSNSFDLVDMLFNVNKGFSGTLHNYLCRPDHLSLNFQEGADGSMLYILSLAANSRIQLIDYKNDRQFLEKIDLQNFHMLIDAGGLIQNMSNLDVAKFLLVRSPSLIKGVIFIDDRQQQMRILTRLNQTLEMGACNIPPQYLFKYIDHSHTTGTDMRQYLTDRGLITLNSQSTLREVFQGAKRLRQLNIQSSQSLVFLLRNAEAKQICSLLNIDSLEALTSYHILCWSFLHTIEQVSQELQIATYHRFHSTIRRRAYQFLLGTCCSERLPKSLSEEATLQLWNDLHDLGILDKYNRVRHEIKLSQLDQLDLTPEARNELHRTLNDLYRYRLKQAESDIVELCLYAFSENINHDLKQILPLDAYEHTADQLYKYCNLIIDKSFGRLLLEEDKATIRIIASHAQRFLPKWLIAKPLSKEVESNHLQVVECLTQIRQQQSEQQSEKIKQQQQERQRQQHTLFKPVPFISWTIKDLLDTKITKLINDSKQSMPITKNLRLFRISEAIGLPFNKELLATENFLKTEEHSSAFHQYAKNILYFLEVQEDASRFFILLDAKEAGYIKHCIQKCLIDTRAVGLYLLPHSLTASTNIFEKKDISPILQVQLYFLNGAADNEIPSYIHDCWQTWRRQCDNVKLQIMHEELQIALSKK